MGWSCAMAASETMDKISKKCVAQTGSQNTYKDGPDSYFWETSRREYVDGAITGSIFKNLPNNMCRKAGSFKIDADGTLSRGPKVMKEMAK